VDVPGGRSYNEGSFTEAGIVLTSLVAIVVSATFSNLVCLVTFSGKNVVAIDSPVGRLGLTVCYDLRFPEIYQQLRFQHEAQVRLDSFIDLKCIGG
jgi:hypothetical protein